jgi:hypothetical protein
LRQSAQQALSDPASHKSARAALLMGRIDEQQSEINYLRALLERIRVKSPKNGIVLLNDPIEWEGRPVTVGERVMTIADEEQVEIEGWLSIGDMMPLVEGSSVMVFLNTDPLQPVRASLRDLAYEATIRPEGVLAYRWRATLTDPGQRPRVGIKGTARIDGPMVTLGYWLFRRPLSFLRQSTGW